LFVPCSRKPTPPFAINKERVDDTPPEIAQAEDAIQKKRFYLGGNPA